MQHWKVYYNLYTVYLALIEVMNETPTTIKATGGLLKVKFGDNDGEYFDTELNRT